MNVQTVTPDSLVLVDSHRIINAGGTTTYVLWCGFLYQVTDENPCVEYTIDLLVERLPKWGSKRKFASDVRKSAKGAGPKDPRPVAASRSTVRRSLALLDKWGLVQKTGPRKRKGRYRRKVAGKMSRQVGKQYLPAIVAKNMGILPPNYRVKEPETKNEEMNTNSKIEALLGTAGPAEAKATQDVGMDAVDREKAISFGCGPDENSRKYYPDNRTFPEETVHEDVEPKREEFGEDSQEFGDEEAYSNPPRFVAHRLVHPSVVYETDLPPMVVQNRGVNRHPQRLIVSEYKHPVFGRYFNKVREDLVVDFDLPSWSFDDFGYEYPDIPSLKEGMTEREQVVLLINAFQAGVEYYTKKKCELYEEGMSQGEKKCILVAARRLMRESIKPHLWVVSYLGTLKQLQEKPWDPKKDKPPKITRVFNPKTVEKHAESGRIEMPTPYYETPTASKARMMARALPNMLWHLRHYENIMQQDIDNLAKRRILQLERMMQTVRMEYRERFASHLQQIQKGRWVWGKSLE